MSSVQTFLIEDPRISKSANNSITVGVKSGPAHSTVQSYKFNSNTPSNTLFNINVPSENTLIDRHILVRGYMDLKLVIPVDGTNNVRHVTLAPSAFPFNQALQSASLNINNSKVNIQSQDILNVMLKQFDQKYLSKNCQGTANYVDKYFAKFKDFDNSTNGNPLGGTSSAEKDSDTMGRGSGRMVVYTDPAMSVVKQPLKYKPSTYQIDGLLTELYVRIYFEEPILGLPCVSMQENDGCFSGVNQLELSFQYSNVFEKCINYKMRNVPNVVAGLTDAASIGTIIQHLNGAGFSDNDDLITVTAVGNILSETGLVVLRYYSLHPSQYAKLSKKSVIPYDEMVAYKLSHNLPNQAAGVNFPITSIMSNVISLRQIPDKLYIFIRPKYSVLRGTYSNHFCIPISTMNVTFNNVSGLLSDMQQEDLYRMSRRNGSQQVFDEFMGHCEGKQTLGGIVVIDCTRDLGLDDMLSASSLGQFSLQMTVTPKDGVEAPWNEYELVIIANYAGLLVTQQGSSSTMSGLLTKEAVITAKSKGSSNIDYDDIQKVSGGNIYKQGKAEVGRLLKSERGRIARAVDDKADGAIDSAAKGLKAMAHDKLAKYY